MLVRFFASATRSRGAWLWSWQRSAAAMGLCLVLWAPTLAAQVDDPTARERTIGRMRNLGTAMMAWLTDVAQANEEAVRVIDVDDYRSISRRRLEALLVPRYIPEIPEQDGWGNDFEVYIETDIDKALRLQSIMLIRSAGSDGRFDTNSYEPGANPELEYSHDIVWVDGFFVRAPAKLLPHRAIPAPMPDPVPIVCPGGVRADLAEPLLGHGAASTKA
jgi:hypothetical protein